MDRGLALTALARGAIATVFSKRRLDIAKYAGYSEPCGVFVTLTLDGELRGCIGFPEGIMPLAQGVAEAARAAAFEDPRFAPLDQEELPRIRIGVTVLTPPQPIIVKAPDEYLERIAIGRDGLIIRKGARSGLLLPQVPVEWGWDARTFLEQLCRKAGLQKNAWKDPDAQILSFQGEIYSEAPRITARR